MSKVFHFTYMHIIGVGMFVGIQWSKRLAEALCLIPDPGWHLFSNTKKAMLFLEASLRGYGRRYHISTGSRLYKGQTGLKKGTTCHGRHKRMRFPCTNAPRGKTHKFWQKMSTRETFFALTQLLWIVPHWSHDVKQCSCTENMMLFGTHNNKWCDFISKESTGATGFQLTLKMSICLFLAKEFSPQIDPSS